MSAQLENTLELYLKKKAPPLPKNVKEMVVSFAPWINVILILIAAPALLAVFGFTAKIAPYAYWAGARLGGMYYISLAFLGITLVLRVMALPGLFSRSMGGWKMLYYSTLVNLVYSAFNYNLFSGVIGAVVGLYFLFQVKASYK
ncbi:hypothetical protein ACFL18_02535 [Patescibacteria group bacterium]